MVSFSYKPKARGFTLIELIVVIVILAILASIAIPSYQEYMRKSRRIDAKNALSALQLAEEKYRANNLAYTTVLTDLGLSTTSPQGYYTIAIQSASGTTYLANATAAGVQASDTSCQKLAATQTGFSTDSSKTDNPSTCWGLE